MQGIIKDGLLAHRDFAQKAKSQEGILVACAYIDKYLQMKYTVSIPEEISICLIRGRMESLSNDAVYIVYARK